MEKPKPPENRNINTGGGNYNEYIGNDYVQGSKIIIQTIKSSITVRVAVIIGAFLIFTSFSYIILSIPTLIKLQDGLTNWNDSSNNIVDGLNIQLDNPIDKVRTLDGRILPAAIVVAHDYKPKPEDFTINNSSCVISFDLNSVPLEGNTIIEDIVVKINQYEKPPKIVEKILPLGIQAAHGMYVQIDDPEIAEKSIFKSEFVNHSKLENIVLKHDSSEKTYIMVGALTPGVYTFEIGIEASYKDVRKTHWITRKTIYFVSNEVN